MEEYWENTMGQGAIMGIYFFIFTLLGEPVLVMAVNMVIAIGFATYLLFYQQLEPWTTLCAGLQFVVGVLAVFVGALIFGNIYGFADSQAFREAVNAGLGFGVVFATFFGAVLCLRGTEQPVVTALVTVFSSTVAGVLLVLILLG